MFEQRPNQLKRDYLSLAGLSPFLAHNSSARVVMFTNHLGQTLTVKGGTERLIQTGMEREYGKYTFNKRTTSNIEIIKVFERYRKTYNQDAIKVNPQTIVLFEDVATKELGILDLPNYCSNHQYFGFDYIRQAAMNKVRQGEFIPADTVLLDSPSVGEDGSYKFGVEANVAFMTIPGVTEDGIIISRSASQKFGFSTYERRIVEFGSKKWPRNIYGTPEVYKPFPDIGDTIREDSLLSSLCNYDPLTSVVEQNRRDSMIPDPFFDKQTFAAGPGGVIVDIIVHHDPYSTQSRTPEGMDEMLLKYDNSRRSFYQDLLDTYNKYKKQRGEALQISKELHQMLVVAIAILDKNDKQKVDKLYHLNPLDDWRLEFVIRYDIVPNIGFKGTDTHGGWC